MDGGDTAVRHAQCLCGAVRAETRGAPWRVMICSCRDCRRKSGSPFSLSTYWDPDTVTLRGETRTWRRSASGDRALTYHLCATCGVALYWMADFAGGRIGIGGGNFDSCDFATPARAYWCEQRPDWVLHLDEVPALDRQ